MILNNFYWVIKDKNTQEYYTNALKLWSNSIKNAWKFKSRGQAYLKLDCLGNNFKVVKIKKSFSKTNCIKCNEKIFAPSTSPGVCQACDINTSFEIDYDVKSRDFLTIHIGSDRFVFLEDHKDFCEFLSLHKPLRNSSCWAGRGWYTTSGCVISLARLINNLKNDNGLDYKKSIYKKLYQKDIKQKGLHSDRYDSNPEELLFALFWDETNKFSKTLDYLLSDSKDNKINLDSVSERDRQVAATVIQWLGSPVGNLFLKDLGYYRKKLV